METINILISLKQENCMNYLILLESLICKNKTNKVALYVLGEETDIRMYNGFNLFLKKHSIYIRYFKTPKYNYSGLDQSEVAVIMSASILPADVNKIIYLNANLLIKRSLIEIWNFDLSGFLFAACEDRWISKGVDEAELAKVNISEKDVYYNTDVLVVNMYAIRKDFPNMYLESINIKELDELSYGLKSFINKYFVKHIVEIKEKKYNTQITSYRSNVIKEKFIEAVIVNYIGIDMFYWGAKDAYEKVYNLWWEYAERYGILNENAMYIARKKRIEDMITKRDVLVNYIRFAMIKIIKPQIEFDKFGIINLLNKSDLWNPFYFTEKKQFQFERKYKKIRKNYSQVQVHCMPCGGAALFFLGIICYKILHESNNVLHILIPATMLAGCTVDNPDFYVHNECVLRYIENAYIPKKEEKEFLRYILSKYFYSLDFSQWNRFSPVIYEDQGGTYEELEKIKVIEFSKKDLVKGETFLHKYHIEGKYACIAPRNNEYKKVYSKTVGANDYLSHRNGSIESYLKAVELIKAEGFELIQMGKINKKSFPDEYSVLNFSKVYDEFLDLYIFSKCSFVIGDGSGLLILSNLFAKPKIQANTEIITTIKEIMGYLREGNDIILPTKYWDEKEHRYLTLREQLALEVKYKRSRFEEKIIELGYIAVTNSAEEIELAAKEMIDNILGKKEYTEDEKYLQDRCMRIIQESAHRNHMRYPRCNIAIGFLKRNKWYLE